jgi:hypothetical protein
MSCPTCREAAKFQGWRTRHPLSLLGVVAYTRAYYHCPHCKTGHFPSDASLGLSAQGLTPAAEELASVAGAISSSFEEAATKTLPKLAGLHLGESTVERTTEAAGERVGTLLAEGHTFGPSSVWEWHRDATGKTCAYLSVDATGVSQQGPGGAKAEGRMATVGMIFNPVPKHFEGGRPRSPSRYLAGFLSLEELGTQLRAQAAQVGMGQAERWIALTDGGNGLEHLSEANFPGAVRILDFWHAAEHVSDLAKALHPQEPEQAEVLRQQWCHTMKHEGGAAILEVLQRLELKCRKAALRKMHQETTRYIGNNVHRMDYPTYEANGWQIGSGAVESACKTVVGQRLKGCGRRWGEEGADSVCHLRALFKSERGQWDAFWQRSIN